MIETCKLCGATEAGAYMDSTVVVNVCQACLDAYILPPIMPWHWLGTGGNPRSPREEPLIYDRRV